MTHRNFVASDHHLGHANIIKFQHEGKPLRDFACVEDHDECIIERHNAVVRPQDRVYFLGDVAINRKYLPLLSRMNGRKVLVKGNHDIFKLSDYLPYFEDIRACVVRVDQCIMTHIPVHPDQIGRFKLNIHGHTHGHKIMDIRSWGFKEMKLGMDRTHIDTRYRNVCMEHINYTPVDLEEIVG